MATIGVTYVAAARLRPSAHRRLQELLDLHHELYNAALEERRGAWSHSRSGVSYAHQSRELTGIRADDPAWAGQDRRMAVATLQRLERAYQRFYANLKAGVPAARAGRPRFKPRHRFRTLEIYSGANRYLREYSPGRYRVQIKGVPPLRFQPQRPLPEGQPETIRIVRKARRVEVHLSYMTEAPEIPAATGRGVGLDVGVSARVVDDRGGRVEGRVIDRRRLNRLQRRLASLREKAKASGRATWAAIPGRGKPRFRLEWQGGPTRQYFEVRGMLAREWERIQDLERNAVHRLSADIIAGLNPGDTVAVENLRIQNMLKNHHLARAISEQSWGLLLTQLEYKAARAGLRFVKVAAAYTSQDCSGCGQVVPKGLSQRVHACPHCGLVLDRDKNAAINILRRAVTGSAGANQGASGPSPGGVQDLKEPPGLPGVAAQQPRVLGPRC